MKNFNFKMDSDKLTKVIGGVTAVVAGVTAVVNTLNQQKKEAEFEAVKKNVETLMKGKES